MNAQPPLTDFREHLLEELLLIHAEVAQEATIVDLPGARAAEAGPGHHPPRHRRTVRRTVVGVAAATVILGGVGVALGEAGGGGVTHPGRMARGNGGGGGPAGGLNGRAVALDAQTICLPHHPLARPGQWQRHQQHSDCLHHRPGRQARRLDPRELDLWHVCANRGARGRRYASS